MFKNIIVLVIVYRNNCRTYPWITWPPLEEYFLKVKLYCNVKILAIDVIKENLVELNLKSTRIQTIDATVVMIKFYQTPSFK